MWSSMRLQELRHNYEELTEIIYEKEKQIQFLETKAQNLCMFYVASQVVIFLWNSEGQACEKHSWKPFLLSLSIAVAFGNNLGSTVVKYARTKQEQDRNHIDRQDNYFHQMNTAAASNSNTTSTVDQEQGQGQKLRLRLRLRPADMFAVYQQYAHLGITLAALLAITALVLHACLPIFRLCS